MAGSEAGAAHLRLHSADVYVRDQDQSLQFYTEKLGFQLAFDARLHTGERWIGVSPPDGSAVLTLRQPKPDSPAFLLIGRPTGIVFVTEDVPGKYREWAGRGVRFSHTPRLRRVKYRPATGTKKPDAAQLQPPVWGEVFTRFEDLDRNSFALVSFDEVNRAIESQRRANAERQEADRRAAQELEIARQVQMRLFPQSHPALRTLDYAGICVQARQVGGDYYDFLNLGRDRLGLVIGDIAGKGIAAALLMANLQANVRTQCAVALDEPRRFLQSVNSMLHQNSVASAYATLLFAEYDDIARRIRYVNCGHLAGLVLRPDGALERLESTSTVLGLFESWDCTVGECQLRPGDTLALYTDGVTECFSDAGVEFGEEGLTESLRRYRQLRPSDVVGAVLTDIRSFSKTEQHDDITLIVAQCCAQ